MLTTEEIKKLESELHSAVKENDLQKAKEYIEKIPKKNISSVINSQRDGRSLLYTAALKNNFEMVKLLIDNHADIHAKDYSARPVLFHCIAKSWCSAQMAEFLINNGASTTGKFTDGDGFFSLLYWAVIKDSPEKAELLLKRGANLGEKFRYMSRGGYTLLHVAVEKNNPEMVKVLIKYHADVDAQNERDDTPLHIAINYKRPEIIKLLYDNGADIGIKNKQGQTPSDYAKIDYPGKTIKEIAAEAESVTDDATQSISAPSSAAKPSPFYKYAYAFNLVRAPITAALSSIFHGTLALPPAQQTVIYSGENSISSSQVSFGGMAFLADVAIRKFTGEKYSRPLDNSLLTIEEVKERKLDAIERDVCMAIEKFDQCPKSSLSNITVSKGVSHQKFF